MEQRTRVLIVSGEVAPFAGSSEIASIVRYLGKLLNDNDDYEVRIMMPRYGTIKERRNRLHEVIRLCGKKIRMGKDVQALKVKVAPLPGSRLHVYFMDNIKFFKRKGLHKDAEGVVFKDNVARSLFFSRAVLETLRNQLWKPNIVHAFGWISGLIPMLFAEAQHEKLLSNAKVIYTPDNVDAQAMLTNDLVKRLQLSFNGEIAGLSLCDVGIKYADATAYPSSLDPSVNGNVHHNVHFSAEHAPMLKQAMALYSGEFAALAQ